ncbi:hypothetical protein ATCC90586_000618 [Pythium insidiosum]|nr:hypothetical protein ATCC90586_000618 [Pythium insidiosum]
MEEAASVVAWFRCYMTRFARSHGVSTRIVETVVLLLCEAFPALYEDVTTSVVRKTEGDEWKIVLAVLEAFYEVALPVEKQALDKTIVLHDDGSDVPAEVIKTLEFVLCAVVQCEQKALFVRDIMTMDDAVQVDIMAVIERIMTTAAALGQNPAGRDDEASEAAERVTKAEATIAKYKVKIEELTSAKEKLRN